MGLFDKLEKRLEAGVNNAFAKAFRAEVQPVELASAVRRAMDDRATSAGKGKRPIVPNLFEIELSTTDHGNLTAHERALADELKASAADHAQTQRYTPGGPLTINFRENDELETGVFKVRPSIARQAQPSPAPTQAPEHLEPERERPVGGFALPGNRHSRPVDEAVHSSTTHEGQYQSHWDAAEHVDEPVKRAPLEPSPAAPKSYKQRPLLDIDGDRYPLMGAITIIGRDDDVDIVLDDSGVSRRHSEVRVTNDGPHLVATLSDLGSTNGTFLNGDRVHSERLQDGDRITVGRTSIIFREGGRR